MPRTLALVCSSPDADPEAGGIRSFAFDEAAGTFTALGGAAHGGNPTFLAIDAARSRVLVAGETTQPTLTSYRLDPLDGRLEAIGVQPTLGRYAAHVAVDSTGGTAFVANYSLPAEERDAAGVAAFAIGGEGQLSAAFWRATYSGNGPVRGRQDATHPHSTLLSPDERLLVVPDLGCDRLFCYRFDAQTRDIVPASPAAIEMPAGSGPRHALFSSDGRFLYVVLELIGAVAVIDVSSSRIIEIVRTLPPGFAGYNISADIQMSGDGTRLYVSNRGHESLAMFDVDGTSGRLTVLGYVPVGGSWPRSFAIDPSGRFVIVANQKTDALVVFAVDPSGLLTETGHRVAVPQPMCIKLARFP